MVYELAAVLFVHILIAAAVLFYLLKRRFDPWAMAFWTVCVLFIPFLGAAAYGLLSEDLVARRAERRLGGWSAPEPFKHKRESKPDLEALPAQWRTVAEISQGIAPTNLTLGNTVEVLDESEGIFEKWKEVIAAAERHVHMLYFTFWSDETGEEFRDLLIRKAREGVQCRVLLDSVGSHSWTWTFWEPLLEAGGEVAFFMPVAHYRRRWSIHLRNHRKLVVVDGRDGFMGSQNIDNDSRGWNREYGTWTDVCLNLRGPAVHELQRVFLGDWAFATDQVLDDPELFPPVEPDGKTPIHIVPTGPDQKERILERILLEAFLQARTSITIATPYFVPSDIFLVGLMRARLRDVQVRIVLPSTTDMPIVLHAGRSYYRELIEDGVEIYEFREGMLHSKIVEIDGTWALTGSANMDRRSFMMNFEISAIVYDSWVAERLARILDDYCARSNRVTLDHVDGKKTGTKVLEGAARLFSPQL